MNIKNSILLVIDMQQAFDDPIFGKPNNPSVDENGLCLLKAFRDENLPIIHVKHDSTEPKSLLRPENLGNRLRPGFEPLPHEPLLVKHVNSAFIGTDLERRLQDLNPDGVVVFGITTDQCVSTTVRMGANLGFNMMVVGDACTCFDLPLWDKKDQILPAQALHDAHLTTLNAEFAKAVSTEEVINSLI